MCQGDHCESKEKIREWLSRKYIVLLYNQSRFNPTAFFDEAKIQEKRIVYIPINSQVREIHQFKVQRTHVNLQDYESLNMHDWTLVKKHDFFKLEQ